MKRVDRTDKTDSPKCNYCGSTEPENGFKTKKVIHRANGGLQESLFTVCAEKPCGGYLQMAYEG